MRKVIFATMVLMLLSSVGYGADWKYIYTAATGGEWFYDTQSISRKQDITKILIKSILSDKEKANYIKHHPKILSIKKISYTSGRWEVDCVKYKFRVLSANMYGSDGNIFYSVGSPNSYFLKVVPGSTIAKLVEIICKEGEGVWQK